MRNSKKNSQPFVERNLSTDYEPTKVCKLYEVVDMLNTDENIRIAEEEMARLTAELGITEEEINSSKYDYMDEDEPEPNVEEKCPAGSLDLNDNHQST